MAGAASARAICSGVRECRRSTGCTARAGASERQRGGSRSRLVREPRRRARPAPREIHPLASQRQRHLGVGERSEHKTLPRSNKPGFGCVAASLVADADGPQALPGSSPEGPSLGGSPRARAGGSGLGARRALPTLCLRERPGSERYLPRGTSREACSCGPHPDADSERVADSHPDADSVANANPESDATWADHDDHLGAQWTRPDRTRRHLVHFQCRSQHLRVQSGRGCVLLVPVAGPHAQPRHGHAHVHGQGNRPVR